MLVRCGPATRSAAPIAMAATTREPMTAAMRRSFSDQQEDPECDEPDRPGDVGDRDDRAGQVPAVALVPTDELERTDEDSQPDDDPDDPEPRGQDRRRQDRAGDEQRPEPGEEVSQMLADTHAEQPVKRRKDGFDRLARRLTVRAIRG